jgi:hypothetical protein
MNQSLINELRALSIKIQIEMNAIEKDREAYDDPMRSFGVYAGLLNAKSHCLNGIAVLVAANKR